MIPRSPLFIAVGLLLALAALAAFYPAAAEAWLVAGAAAAVVAAVDALRGFSRPPPEIERRLPGSMALATWSQVSFVIRNTGPKTVDVVLYDLHPPGFASRGLPAAATVPAGRFAEVGYELRPTARGLFRFEGTDLRQASPLGLWWRRIRLPLADSLRVYPNYSTIRKLLAYEVENHLQLAGVRMSRRRGEGIEFHQLRDYRDGDSLRAIDWKATSRMTRLIAREYQDERDQQVVFLLDAGRRMLARDAELSHFDHALNAMLLMAYVALRQGDAIGVMTVGDSRRWLPPRKGMTAINGILNHVYDVNPAAIEIDYVGAATELAVRQRRRSLIVFLSNVREEDSEDLRLATTLLNRRHLVMLASLRERALDERLERPVGGLESAITYAATNQYLAQRREAQNLLKARGVFVDDCLSDDLPAAITSRYFAIKRAGLL